MTIKELYAALNKAVPADLSAAWDHDGLACCPDSGREVRRVLIALDVTDRVVEHAIKGGFDVVLTHHPLLFRGLQELTDQKPLSKKLLRLAAAGISAISLHTRLDAAEGGVNDTLALLLGLQSLVPFGTEDTPTLGRIGRLPRPISARVFAAFVKERLGSSAVLFAGDPEKPVSTVALVGGEGGDLLDAAVAAGADLFLSGRIGYHRMLDAAEGGLALIEAGHYATEAPVTARLSELVRAIDPSLQLEVISSRVIEIV